MDTVVYLYVYNYSSKYFFLFAYNYCSGLELKFFSNKTPGPPWNNFCGAADT